MFKILLFTLAFCCILLSEADAQLVSVDIEEIQLRELYAVEYRSYTEEPIGTVTMYNPTSRDLRAAVVLSGERYINAPIKTSANLPAKQKTEIPLYLDLDISVLDLSRRVERIPISIEISTYLGSVRVNSDVRPMDVTVHDKYKLPEGHPSKIAAFVDPGDKYVMSEVTAGMGSTGEEKAAAAFALLQ